MTSITFDTHEFVTELKQAGLTESQEEVITRLHLQSTSATIEYVKHEFSVDDLVTKKDLDARITEAELKIKLVRSELKRDIETVRKEIAETKADLSGGCWLIADNHHYRLVAQIGRFTWIDKINLAHGYAVRCVKLHIRQYSIILHNIHYAKFYYVLS